MSEAYNPETVQFEQLEALELEARQLRHQLQSAKAVQEKKILEQQLKELEHQIEVLRRRLKP